MNHPAARHARKTAHKLARLSLFGFLMTFMLAALANYFGDVASGIPAARKWRGVVLWPAKFQRACFCVRLFPPGWEARLHGRQGC